MNTPLDPEPEDLRYAEYVLGVLDANERATVEREIANDPSAAVEMARWQEYLSPLAEDFPVAAPPAHIWTHIQTALGTRQVSRESFPTTSSGWWNNLAVWRGLAFGALAVAAACIIAIVALPRGSTPPSAPPAVAYMASTLSQINGQVGWTATVDLQQARMVVVAAQPQTLPVGRAPELWLIPAGQKPIAVGMIAANGATTITLRATLVAKLGPTATLAVSVEPPGGSPTGQPTGQVIAKGAIGAAAQGTGKPVAMLHLSERTIGST